VDRRRFLGTVAGGLLAAPLAAAAQQARKVYRIGWLGIRQPAPSDAGWEAFVAGLRELGYVEGRNIVFERRFTEDLGERNQAYVAELVRMEVDVILISDTRTGHAAKAATSSIPIILVGVADPDQTGLVASLARPGGNVTGVSNQAFAAVTKGLQFLKEALPRLTKLAVLWNPSNEASALGWRMNEDYVRALGMAAISRPIANSAELEPALAAVAAQRPGALMVHAVMALYRKRIIEFALSQRLPTFVEDRRWAEAGALLTYSASRADIGRSAAAYVDKVLKGVKPADLPVEQPTKFDLVINLKTAKALGLTIPPSLLARADQVIE
jgi:putative ABC transport system substrate-binding protein